MNAVCRYRLPPEVVHTALDGAEGPEAVLLDVPSRRYFSLNETGLLIFTRLADGASEAQAAGVLVERFQTTPEAAARDVRALAAKLLMAGLLAAD